MIGTPEGALQGVQALRITIEAHERAEYTRHYTTTSGSGKSRKTNHHTQRHKMHKEWMSISKDVIQPMNGIISNGIHDLGFSFVTP
jgi:hypothetical protein